MGGVGRLLDHCSHVLMLSYCKCSKGGGANSGGKHSLLSLFTPSASRNPQSERKDIYCILTHFSKSLLLSTLRIIKRFLRVCSVTQERLCFY